jgi:hypothetical protein
VNYERFDSFLENGDINIVLPNSMQEDFTMHNRGDLSREHIIGYKNINATYFRPLTELNTSKPLAILETRWEILNIVEWLIRIRFGIIWILLYDKPFNIRV